jgi:excisionase family DNA binding protein
MATTAASEPLYISVTEAAHLLGISRSHAYDQAHLGLATNGAEGLPAVRLGRRVLINRAHVAALTASAQSASGVPDLRQDGC